MRFLSPERSGCHILNLSKFSKVFHMTLWPGWEPLVQRGPGLTGTESCGCLCWRLGLMRRGYWWKHFWSETHNPSSFWSTFTLLDESQPSLVRAEQVHLLQTLPAYVSMLGFFSWLHNSSFITLIRTLGIHVQGYHGDVPTLVVFCPPFLPHPHSTSSSLPWMLLAEIHLIFLWGAEFGHIQPRESILGWTEKGGPREPQLTWPLCFMYLSSEISSKPAQYHSATHPEDFPFPWQALGALKSPSITLPNKIRLFGCIPSSFCALHFIFLCFMVKF